MTTMKSASTSLLVFIVLCVLEAMVSARPFADSILLAKRDGAPLNGLINRRNVDSHSSGLAKKDNPQSESEALINTPFIMSDDEPIKRDSGGSEPEALINTPFLLDDNEPVKRDGGDFESEVMVNTPSIIDLDSNKPIRRNEADLRGAEERSAIEGPEKQKRRMIPGVNPINYFGNERVDEADGSDDLFQGINGGRLATKSFML